MDINIFGGGVRDVVDGLTELKVIFVDDSDFSPFLIPAPPPSLFIYLFSLALPPSPLFPLPRGP